MELDTRSRNLRALAAIVILFAAFHTAAQTLTIDWAGGTYGDEKPAYASAANLNYVPNGKCTIVSRSSWVLTAGFKHRAAYPMQATDPNLVKVLGLSARDLETYDIIAFEGNSNHLPFGNSMAGTTSQMNGSPDPDAVGLIVH